MATAASPQGLNNPHGAQVVDYQQYIDDELRRTQARVKGIEIFGACLVLAAGVLSYLLAVVVIDQWLVPGGLGTAGRFLALAVLVALVGWYVLRRIAPLVLGRISPVYAAYVIERAQPSLKNSLLNFLLLRRAPARLPQPVLEALKQRAALDLSQTPTQHAVDSRGAIRAGYVLIGILAACALYIVLSPKSALQSARRILAPWSDLAAPTRVAIEDVQPGHARVFVDEHLTVKAVVRGPARHTDDVRLVYSTADGRVVDRPIPMQRSADGYQHEAVLPESVEGLQQSVTYHVEAGDARSPQYQVAVVPPPSIAVRRLFYEYPAYTGFSPRETQQGDIAAIEGTKVTLYAEANSTIRDAYLDFDADRTYDLPLKAEGRKATGVIRQLRLKPDRITPEYASYQVLFQDESGQVNPRPVQYKIEVIPDRPPQVQFAQPQSPVVRLPRNGVLALQLRASDPDFALSQVLLRVQRGQQTLREETLLDGRHEGPFEAAARIDAAELQLRVGDVLLCQAEAADNKQPQPQVSRTDPLRIEIVEPTDEATRQEQLARADEAQQRPFDPRQQPGEQDQRDPHQPQRRDEPSDQEPAQPRQAEDGGAKQPPKADERQAFKQLVEQAQRQQKPQPDNQPADQPQQDPNGGQQPQPGGQGQEGSQRPAPADQPQYGNRDGSQEAAGSKDQPAGQPGQPTQSRPMTDGGQAGSEPSDGKPSDGGQSGSEPSGGDPADRGQSGGGRQPGQSSQQRPDRQPGAEAGDARDDTTGNGPSKTSGGQRQPRDPSTQPAQGNPGSGAQTQEGETGQAAKPPKSGDNRTDRSGGDPATPKGNSGAGRSGDNPQGSPEPQATNAPHRDKRGDGQQPDNDRPQDSAQSPTTSPRESDSQGDEQGDRSGGGGQGGGQKANNPGTGGAGQNTESDEGGSKSAGSGDGETSQRGGDRQPGDRATGGARGDQAGEGAPTRPAGSRDADPAQSGRQGTSGQSDQNDPRGDSITREGPTPGQPRPGTGAGGQRPGESQPQGVRDGGSDEPPAGRRHTEAPADRGPQDPNLEYTRQATNLALEHLRDMLNDNQPDPELLKKLNWSREDLERFYRHWESLRQAAQRDPAARKQFEDALRRLDLQPRGTSITSDGRRNDRLRGLDRSRLGAPPAEYRDLYRAYSEGISQGEDSR